LQLSACMIVKHGDAKNLQFPHNRKTDGDAKTQSFTRRPPVRHAETKVLDRVRKKCQANHRYCIKLIFCMTKVLLECKIGVQWELSHVE
jgi:hypothetical protein